VVGVVPQLWAQIVLNNNTYARWKSLIKWRRLTGFDQDNLININRVKEIKIYGLEHHILSLWRQHFDLYRGGRVKLDQNLDKSQGLFNLLDGILQLGVQLWLVGKVLDRQPGFGLGEF
jgi:hypothetical protein